jgi:hypothetical protein
MRLLVTSVALCPGGVCPAGLVPTTSTTSVGPGTFTTSVVVVIENSLRSSRFYIIRSFKRASLMLTSSEA